MCIAKRYILTYTSHRKYKNIPYLVKPWLHFVHLLLGKYHINEIIDSPY